MVLSGRLASTPALPKERGRVGTPAVPRERGEIPKGAGKAKAAGGDPKSEEDLPESSDNSEHERRIAASV